MSVYCAAVDCKYNSDTNRCTAKSISLYSHSVMTVWEGRQEFWRCKNYELSDEAKRLSAAIKQMMEGK